MAELRGDCFASLAMTLRGGFLRLRLAETFLRDCHCDERSDEAITSRLCGRWSQRSRITILA